MLGFGEAQGRVRTHSRNAWNTWVGASRFRESVAYGFAVANGVIALVCTIGWWQASHQTILPPAVITTDSIGQVIDFRAPRELPKYRDVDVKHFLASCLSNMFTVYDSADALAANYEKARFCMLPGSQAFVDVQKYWDKFSPLRRFPDGTLHMPNAPERKVTTDIPSFIPRGHTSDGAEMYDVSWSETSTSYRNPQDVLTQRLTGQIEFVRSYEGSTGAEADRFLVANPFGLRIRFFRWDYQR